MTGKLPGDLASPVAGPILLLGGWLVETRVIVLRDGAYDTTGVIVGSTGGSSRMVWAHAWCETRQVALSDLAIPLDHVSGAGMDLAARWLSVHLGNWQYWEVIRGVCGHHATLSSVWTWCAFDGRFVLARRVDGRERRFSVEAWGRMAVHKENAW